MQNGQDHMEESERIAENANWQNNTGRSGGISLRYLAQLTPEEQAEDVTYARRLAVLWENAHGMGSICAVPADAMCSFGAAVKGQNCPYEKWEQEGETHDTRSGNIL